MHSLLNKNMLDNSIIVFTSDNGAPFGPGSNWPLRGRKHTAFEGGVRGVAAVWSSDLKHQKRVSSALMHAVDWVPTLLRAVENTQHRSLAVPPRGLDGIDLWDAFENPHSPSPRKDVLISLEDTAAGGLTAIRVGDFKLVSGQSKLLAPNEAPDSSGWTYPQGDVRSLEQQLLVKSSTITCPFPPPTEAQTSCQPDVAPCLFHIVNDPCEYFNIAEKNKPIVDSLSRRLDQYKLSKTPSLREAADPGADPHFYNNTWVSWQDQSFEAVAEGIAEEALLRRKKNSC